MDLQTLIKTTLQNDTVPTIGLRALGLPATKSVFQADTLESPSSKPFIIVRWLDVQAGMGRMKRRPFLLWVYDDEGDYSRAKRMAQRAADVLCALPQTQIDGGWLGAIEDREMGAELADPGWQAVVVPYNLLAVASGV
jgi:hypothetical protein